MATEPTTQTRNKTTLYDVIEIICAILFPPLGVFLATGCSCDLLINILLTCLGYIPGMIHALYVILSR